MTRTPIGCRRRQLRVGHVAALVFWTVVSGGSDEALAQKHSTEPIKLVLKSRTPVFRVGEQPILEVSAVDSAGKPTPVWKEFSVDILSGSGPEAKKVFHTLLKKGNAAIEVAVPQQSQPGFYYFEAANPELLPGGTYIDVRAAAAPTTPTGARRPAQLAVALRIGPQREFLADGTDGPVVQAFFTAADAAPNDVAISLSSDCGNIEPNPLVIRKGESRGEAVLTSERTGECTIEIGGSKPQASADAPPAYKVRFITPATHLNVRSSLAEVRLFDTPEIIVELVDSKGAPVVLERARTITLELAAGRAVIDQAKLQIPAGESSAKTLLHPSWFGELILVATVSGMTGIRVFLPVIAPEQQLALAFFVGIVGGSLVLVQKRGMPPWRVVIGGLMGFVFYWACLWWGLPVVPRTLLLHPVCVIVLAALGGWSGTLLYAAVLRPVDKAFAGRE